VTFKVKPHTKFEKARAGVAATEAVAVAEGFNGRALVHLF